MPKVYCGTKNKPRGSSLGTRAQCIKTRQLRRHGNICENKVDTSEKKALVREIKTLQTKIDKFSADLIKQVDRESKMRNKNAEMKAENKTNILEKREMFNEIKMNKLEKKEMFNEIKRLETKFKKCSGDNIKQKNLVASKIKTLQTDISKCSGDNIKQKGLVSLGLARETILHAEKAKIQAELVSLRASNKEISSKLQTALNKVKKGVDKLATPQVRALMDVSQQTENLVDVYAIAQDVGQVVYDALVSDEGIMRCPNRVPKKVAKPIQTILSEAKKAIENIDDDPNSHIGLSGRNEAKRVNDSKEVSLDRFENLETGFLARNAEWLADFNRETYEKMKGDGLPDVSLLHKYADTIGFRTVEAKAEWIAELIRKLLSHLVSSLKEPKPDLDKIADFYSIPKSMRKKWKECVRDDWKVLDFLL
jgi:hypothetical protein